MGDQKTLRNWGLMDHEWYNRTWDTPKTDAEAFVNRGDDQISLLNMFGWLTYTKKM